MRLLLEAKESHSRTPLSRAARQGRGAVVRLLISHAVKLS